MNNASSVTKSTHKQAKPRVIMLIYTIAITTVIYMYLNFAASNVAIWSVTQHLHD